MNKVAHYLQEHLTGEVMTGADARRYFSTDGSIFQVTPAIISYPRNENDVRKTARFSWQLAERGRIIPITARGSGTDQGGAAIGAGIIMVFPAHMNRILELDAKSGLVAVEPGLNYAKLQQTLHTHGRFLPPYPASLEYTTIGGAVANNASGEKTFKYGDTRKYVKGMRVVLSNGEVIETKRLSKRELNRKMGLATFEGEVYRALDTLIEENHDLVKDLGIDVTKNSAGYALADVKEKNGSFDLTPLFVGSQATLGIVTEINLATQPYVPGSTLFAAYITDIAQAGDVVMDLRKMANPPSAIEVVDDNLLNFIHETNPNQLGDVIKPPFPKLVMLIEFDDISGRNRKKATKKAEKILQKHGVEFKIETEEADKEKLWKIRHSAGSVISHAEGNTKALPIVEDGVVPPENFSQYLEGVYEIFKRNKLKIAVWGHAGNANLHMQPFLDLGQVGDRQRVFRLIEEYYSLIIELGGSTSGEHGDGRLRAPYLEKLYGPEAYELFGKVKNIFDPYGIMNPGVKVGVGLEDIKPLVRSEYSIDHLYDHMPRS